MGDRARAGLLSLHRREMKASEVPWDFVDAVRAEDASDLLAQITPTAHTVLWRVVDEEGRALRWACTGPW